MQDFTRKKNEIPLFQQKVSWFEFFKAVIYWFFVRILLQIKFDGQTEVNRWLNLKAPERMRNTQQNVE